MRYCPKCGGIFVGWFHMCYENCGYSVELESVEELEEEIEKFKHELALCEDEISTLLERIYDFDHSNGKIIEFIDDSFDDLKLQLLEKLGGL